MFYEIPLLNWGCFILINSIMLMSAYCLASRLGQRLSFPALAAASILLYLAQAILSVLMFGVAFRALNAVTLGIFNGATSLILLAFFWRQRRPFWISLDQGLRHLLGEKDRWLYVFLGLLIMQVLLNLAKAFVLPVHVWDSFTYHASPAPMWFQLGQIPLQLDVPVTRINGKALGVTVLMYWYFIFLKDSVLVNLPQTVMSIVLIFTTFAACRQCGVSRGWALKITTLVYFLPVVLLHSVTTQDHLSINTAFLCAIFFMREWARHGGTGILALAGVSIGLMMQFKINAVIYFPVLGLAFLYLLWERQKNMRKVFSLNLLGKPVAMLGVIAIATGGYWYGKNLYVYGDIFGPLFGSYHPYEIYEPIHSEKILTKRNNLNAAIIEPLKSDFSEVASKPKSTEVASHFVRLSTFLNNIALIPERVLDVKNLFEADLTGVSGFGPQFFTFGLITIVVIASSMFRRSVIHDGFYGITGLGMLLLYFFVMNNIFAYRNFSFFPVLLLIQFGVWASSRQWLQGSAFIHSLSVMILISTLWSFWVTLPPTFANPLLFKEYSSLDRPYQSPIRYVHTYLTSPKTLRELDEFPQNEPLAYVNSDQPDVWIYPYYDRHWKRRVEYYPMQSNHFSCDEKGDCMVDDSFIEILKKKNIHLLSTCINHRCLKLSGNNIFEINRGLYVILPKVQR